MANAPIHEGQRSRVETAAAADRAPGLSKSRFTDVSKKSKKRIAKARHPAGPA